MESPQLTEKLQQRFWAQANPVVKLLKELMERLKHE